MQHEENQWLSCKMFPLGDRAIVLQFGTSISEDVHKQVKSFASYLDKNPFPGMIEYVPAFTTLTIYYHPWIVSEYGKYAPYEKVVGIIEAILPQVKEQANDVSRTIEIPVCYGGEFGPDLSFVASYTGLTEQEVIAVHAGREYVVYMIGFAPGFPYLGGMDSRITTPRKQTPRLTIPPGSVGIGGSQTGIYSMETPGGWQLIGRTPLTLFSPDRQMPSLLQAGDRVRFVPITQQVYKAKKGQEHEY